MEFYSIEKIDEWYFKLKLPYIDRKRVAFNRDSLKYLYAIKRYVRDIVTDYLYQEELEDGVFKFNIGMAAFVYNEFYRNLDERSIELLEDILFSREEYDVNFPGLYNYQNEDLRTLLTMNRGMFQTYTGYGKSEVIATLANFLYEETDLNVIIVTANSTAYDEIKHRIKTLFGLESGYLDYGSKLNILNLNGVLRSSWYDPNHEFWKEEFCILADEVESCVSDTAMGFYETLGKVKYMYGFSATSDKKKADPVYSRVPDEILNTPEMLILKNDTNNRFESSLKYLERLEDHKSTVRDILGRNKNVVSYFGTSVIFRKPRDFRISMIDVVTTISQSDLELPSDYVYSEIIYELFTAPKMCELIEAITYKVGTIFIPMFRLQVIDHWLETIFRKKDFLVLVISGRGFQIYEDGELLGNITMGEMKKMVRDDVIGVILGTKSSYSALDLPELKRSLLLYSKTANIVIQAIGRTARQNEFEVYSIVPINNIPTYTKDLIERKSLIYDYYSDCKIIDYKYNENVYGY